MSIAKIQTGDKVKIIAGNFKGHVGQVLKIKKKVYPNKTVRKFVYVSGVRKIVKYRSKQSFQGQVVPGAVFEVDRPIDISNVMLVDDKGQVSRVAIKTLQSGKVRVYKTTGSIVTKQKVEENEKKSKSDSLQQLQTAKADSEGHSDQDERQGEKPKEQGRKSKTKKEK